jgi:eukaryotic-like serine/threonine-protein kinase
VTVAERDVRSLLHEDAPWCHPLARLLQAGVLATRGRPERAITELTAARAGLGAADMAAYAAAATRRLGQLLGGDEGRALVEQADAFWADQQVVDPARVTAILAPGFGEG